MKKRIIPVLILLLIPFFTYAVDKNIQSDNKSTIVVTGYIVSKGNMPFIEPAIKADDGNEYSIICTQKQKRRLLDLQGKHLRFTLVQNDQINYVVKKYKVIK